MAPNNSFPISVPMNMRGRRHTQQIEAADKPFFLAVSRAFLSAVMSEDRSSAVLYSRAMLSLLNKGGRED